jgi:hypothetical protein
MRKAAVRERLFFSARFDVDDDLSASAREARERGSRRRDPGEAASHRDGDDGVEGIGLTAE